MDDGEDLTLSFTSSTTPVVPFPCTRQTGSRKLIHTFRQDVPRRRRDRNQSKASASLRESRWYQMQDPPRVVHSHSIRMQKTTNASTSNPLSPLPRWLAERTDVLTCGQPRAHSLGLPIPFVCISNPSPTRSDTLRSRSQLL